MKKKWKIWIKFIEAGSRRTIGYSLHQQEYFLKYNAEKQAKQLNGAFPDVECIVSQENPWPNENVIGFNDI